MSLFEQPSFEPVAVSLTGQATFTNVNGVRVPVGGNRHAVVVGAQTSAAQQASAVEGEINNTGNTARLDFAARELAIVSQRGGFQRGDVLVGDLVLGDFGTRRDGGPKLPGALDFVLQWSGATPTQLNDLTPGRLQPAEHHDHARLRRQRAVHRVADAEQPQVAAASADDLPPKHSRTGGQISLNSVGPKGLELAYWPGSFPTGNYRVVVYDLVDASAPPHYGQEPGQLHGAGVREGQWSDAGAGQRHDR